MPAGNSVFKGKPPLNFSRLDVLLVPLICSTRLAPAILRHHKFSREILTPCVQVRLPPGQSTCLGYSLLCKQIMSSAPQIHKYFYKKLQLSLLSSIRRSCVPQAYSPCRGFNFC